MIPAWLIGPAAKLIGAGILIAALTGGYFYWRGVQRDVGRQECIDASKAAVDEQRAKDRVLSDRLIAGRDAYIRELESSGGQVREVIKYATPSTCPADPALDAVSDWVTDRMRRLAPGAGGSPARRAP